MSHEGKDYIQILHSRGYRVTSHRLIVLDAICELAGHATIADIRAKVNALDNTISLSTVYRALAVLTDAGLVVESEIQDGHKVYRIAGEAKHHHLICQSCGSVQTIAQEVLTPLLQAILADYGFTVIADHLGLKGFCCLCNSN